MPPVLIACPVTGELVPTGVDVHSLDELEVDHLLIACPECSQDHEWGPTEAVLPPAYETSVP